MKIKNLECSNDQNNFQLKEMTKEASRLKETINDKEKML
jgi:hypothetical protein